MNQFYSYIKISPNPAVGDSLAIGILLYDGKRFRHHISEVKKKSASKLLRPDFNLDLALKGIVSKSQSIDADQAKNELFLESEKYSNPTYFNYLSNYSNGIIQFSKPQMISGEINNDKFKKLTNALFPEDLEKKERSYSEVYTISKIVNDQLISKVENLVHINRKVTEDDYPGLYFDYEMNILGKNGTLVGAKVMSFEQGESALQNSIFRYNFLINYISPVDLPQQDNHFYLVGNEPSTSLKKHHRIWESVRKNPVITLVHEDESGTIADHIINVKAKKFLL